MEAARQATNMKITPIYGDSIAWIKVVPLKVFGFIWKARIGHNLVAIEKRGVQFSFTNCQFVTYIIEEKKLYIMFLLGTHTQGRDP